MAVNDIYQLIDRQAQAGQTIINVYFYRQTSVVPDPNPSADLLDAFQTEALPTIAGVQSGELLHTGLSVKNLFDASDTAEEAISVAGGQGTGEYLPIFNAVNFTFNHNNGAVRPGSKRLAGLLESYTNDGVITDTGAITALGTVGGIFETTLEGIIGSANWVPVVVKRILDGSSYRLPETLAEAVFGTITSAVWNALVSSQVSRKIGVGE